MAVTLQVPVSTHTGNDVSVNFAYDFFLPAAADLLVQIDGATKVLTTDYSVAGVGADAGGIVTFVNPPAADAVIVFKRVLQAKRETTYQQVGDLLADVHNPDHDYPIRLVQQVLSDLVRSFKGPASVTAEQGLSEAQWAARHGKLLGFDLTTGLLGLFASLSGSPLVSAYIETLLDDPDAPTARGTLGAAADADVFKKNVEDQALTGGAIVTSKSLGTIASGTVTPDPGDRPIQHYTNGGAHTLAPSANVGVTVVEITNNASAGAITTSGFDLVDGDDFTTTNGHVFVCTITITPAKKLLQVVAMQ
jgi:hypothetical protein